MSIMPQYFRFLGVGKVQKPVARNYFSYLEELKPAISSCVPSDFIHYDDATTGYKRHQKAVDGESQHNSQGARCPVQIHMTTGFSTFCALDREKGLGTFNATIKKYRNMSIKYLMLFFL